MCVCVCVLRYDVLFMTEPLDELTVQAIGEYDGKALTDLGKENVDLGGDESDKAKKDEQSSETAGKPFAEVCWCIAVWNKMCPLPLPPYTSLRDG